jgi:predicted NUDIX family NTP pyrophosphohydrolase
MVTVSAGLLVYRRGESGVEVFLVHPGGPFWAKKDEGAWSIPKGELESDEEPLAAARREFEEETAVAVAGRFVPLTPIVQASGKRVVAWAVEGDLDAAAIRSNTFTIEWPPRSGRQQAFPEVARGAWFAAPEARRRILPAQVSLIDQLEAILDEQARGA